MTQDTSPATPPLIDPNAAPQRRSDQISGIAAYLEVNASRFTEESLLKAALDRGYPADVVEEARRRVHAAAPSAPAKRRARRWVLIAYALTFAVLVAGMFLNEKDSRYGATSIGIGVLAATLGLALLISLATLRSQGRAGDGPPVGIAALLAIPVVLLVVVAGLCVMTGLPIPQTY